MTVRVQTLLSLVRDGPRTDAEYSRKETKTWVTNQNLRPPLGISAIPGRDPWRRRRTRRQPAHSAGLKRC